MSETKANNTQPNDTWKPTEDNKSKATTFRVISIILWVIAIGFEIWAIMKLLKNQVADDGMTMLIVFIAIALICAVVGNLLWKKANRLDPASEKEPFKFFVQNQLGAIISALAFLPLLIVVLTDKNISGKQKGILGAIAGIALLAGVGTGIDFNPQSIEKYTEETRRVKEINNGIDLVYYTKYGKKYHTHGDCHHINGEDNTKMSGTVASAYEQKSISELCKTCEKKSIKVNGITEIAEELEAAE